MSNINIKDFASVGGKAVLEKHGKTHMKQLAKRGGQAVAEKYGGKEYFSKLGKISAENRRKRKEEEKRGRSGFVKLSNLLTKGRIK